MEFICIKCSEVLKKPGALIFSYPNEYDLVYKYHVCQKCWHESLLTWMETDINKEKE
jgi:hypothetical protein